MRRSDTEQNEVWNVVVDVLTEETSLLRQEEAQGEQLIAAVDVRQGGYCGMSGYDRQPLAGGSVGELAQSGPRGMPNAPRQRDFALPALCGPKRQVTVSCPCRKRAKLGESKSPKMRSGCWELIIQSGVARALGGLSIRPNNAQEPKLISYIGPLASKLWHRRLGTTIDKARALR